MELVKKNIHVIKEKSNGVSQRTMEQDYNVPEAKPDVGTIIQEKGEIIIDEKKLLEHHAYIKGNLEFKVLYIEDSGEGGIFSLSGKIPFEEQLQMEGAEINDIFRLKWELEDLNVSLIHSRKLSVKALVTFEGELEHLYDEEIPVKGEGDSTLQCLYKEIEVLQPVIQKRDIFRIREEVQLPSNKPNIYEIIWDSVQLRGVDIRPLEHQIMIKGEVLLFLLYTAEGEEKRVEFFETTLPFNGAIECSECSGELVSQIDSQLVSKELVIKPDYDEEDRMVQLEGVLELQMKLYQEEKIPVLMDAYSVGLDLTPQKHPVAFDRLLIHNQAKCRVADRITKKNPDIRILQICHSEGDVKVDEVRQVEDGILVEGAVEVKILYITADDTKPFHSIKGMVPFSHTIEAKGLTPNCRNKLSASLEQLSTTMADSEEVEIKAVLSFELIVFQEKKEEIITDIKEAPLDMEKIKELPGMVGYFVSEEKTLWDIARESCTTMEQMKELNDISGDRVQSGDKLIVLKVTPEITSTN